MQSYSSATSAIREAPIDPLHQQAARSTPGLHDIVAGTGGLIRRTGGCDRRWPSRLPVQRDGDRFVGGLRGRDEEAGRPLDPAEVGRVLLDAAADRSQRVCPDCSLVQFTQSGATYLFDLASAADAEVAGPPVAGWAVTPAAVARRDVSYQRGFPLAPDPGGSAVDRGHLIPHLSGGQFGPNIFRQDRALNRGWSPEGRRFRALEREAAASPGTFYFGHLLYDDDSAYPVAIEIGITRGGTLHAERFQNRFPAGH